MSVVIRSRGKRKSYNGDTCCSNNFLEVAVKYRFVIDLGTSLTKLSNDATHMVSIVSDWLYFQSIEAYLRNLYKDYLFNKYADMIEKNLPQLIKWPASKITESSLNWLKGGFWFMNCIQFDHFGNIEWSYPYMCDHLKGGLVFNLEGF